MGILTQTASRVADPFIPKNLVGRQAELNQISSVLAADGDLLIAGVPGSGRRRLIRCAAEAVSARVIEIDCLRATHSQKFLTLLAEGILATFFRAGELRLIQRWLTDRPLQLDTLSGESPRLIWQPTATDEWQLFQALLSLPQTLAEALNCRVVIVFQDFPHIRTWDRSETWERYLRQEIQRQSQVSYALIATVAESWVQHSEMQVVFLGPIKREDFQPWLVQMTIAQGLRLDGPAINMFWEAVQGNMGGAIALLRRIWMDSQQLIVEKSGGSPDLSTYLPIAAAQVDHGILSLVEDLSLTFESLLLLLPASQVRVLESLALDPTDSPHSREYIQKHHLSRGGGLQGALASLQQKGLVYGQEYGYRIAMPFLAVWLQQRLA